MKLLEEWNLPHAHVGKKVHIYESLPSTNTHCLQLADDASNAGLVVIAHSQSAGRGQHGRTWVSEPGMGLWMSILMAAPAVLARPVLLTAWAAVSVCDCVQNIAGLTASIKWPNDVLIEGRKVCGILIEQRANTFLDENAATVVGIGLNLNQPQHMFDAASLPFAASLHTLTGDKVALQETARELMGELDQNYSRLVQGDRNFIEERWSERLGLLGAAVEVEGHTETYFGQLVELSFEGLVLAQENPSHPRIIAPEKVRHVRKES